MGTVTHLIATSDAGLPTCCFCRDKIRHGALVNRPDFSHLQIRTPAELDRLAKWLKETPLAAWFCDVCIRAETPPALLALIDRRLPGIATANLWFRVFGHPTLGGKADWRPVTRSPLATKRYNHDRPPETERALRRWIKRARAYRRRLRRRVRNLLCGSRQGRRPAMTAGSCA
jgi:hypothetical protein